jgi:putative transposase
MARTPRVELPGALYHVTARGIERRPIFRDDDDRLTYLNRLAECRARYGFRVVAFCLMDNHVHLAIERGPGRLSSVMLALHSCYAQRFNLRHRRVGHLFQGRYKAFLVQNERYLFSLIRYIHLNPVAAGIVPQPEAYRWSSDRFYRDGGGPAWLETGGVLGRLDTQLSAAVIVYKRLMARREEQSYEDVVIHGRVVKGEPDFAEASFGASGQAWQPLARWTPERLAATVAREEGFSMAELAAPGKLAKASRARLMAAYLGRSEAGFSLARMAACFGREESTFSRGVRRLEALVARDGSVRQRIVELTLLLRRRNTGIHD